jgi:hypothetical protein
MAKSMTWTQIRTLLKDARNDVLLDILKGLYDLSPQNKAFLRSALSPEQGDPELLEKSRKQVIRAIYPLNVNFPDYPRFGESRKAIRAYQKATGDVKGTLDLMLTHVERGNDYTNDFGDIDERFYIALETMLGNAIDLLLKQKKAQELYEHFGQRFQKLGRATRDIGWGYGDNVSDMIDELQNRFNSSQSKNT